MRVGCLSFEAMNCFESQCWSRVPSSCGGANYRKVLFMQVIQLRSVISPFATMSTHCELPAKVE